MPIDFYHIIFKSIISARRLLKDLKLALGNEDTQAVLIAQEDAYDYLADALRTTPPTAVFVDITGVAGAPDTAKVGYGPHLRTLLGPKPKIVVYWTNSIFPTLPNMTHAGVDDFVAQPDHEKLKRVLGVEENILESQRPEDSASTTDDSLLARKPAPFIRHTSKSQPRPVVGVSRPSVPRSTSKRMSIRQSIGSIQMNIADCIENENIITERLPDQEAVEVTQQGNLEMYSMHNLRKRKQLLNHQGIRVPIGLLWSVVNFRKTEHGMIPKQDYITMIVKLHRLLIKDFDEERATANARQDWERDVQRVDGLPNGFMNFEAFYRSMFELVDNWCNSVDVHEYIIFLFSLIDGITCEDPGGDSSAAELRWKSDGQISYRGFEASQERRRHSRIFLGGAMYNATHGSTGSHDGSTLSKTVSGMHGYVILGSGREFRFAFNDHTGYTLQKQKRSTRGRRGVDIANSPSTTLQQQKSSNGAKQTGRYFAGQSASVLKPVPEAKQRHPSDQRAWRHTGAADLGQHHHYKYISDGERDLGNHGAESREPFRFSSGSGNSQPGYTSNDVADERPKTSCDGSEQSHKAEFPNNVGLRTASRNLQSSGVTPPKNPTTESDDRVRAVSGDEKDSSGQAQSNLDKSSQSTHQRHHSHKHGKSNHHHHRHHRHHRHNHRHHRQGSRHEHDHHQLDGIQKEHAGALSVGEPVSIGDMDAEQLLQWLNSSKDLELFCIALTNEQKERLCKGGGKRLLERLQCWDDEKNMNMYGFEHDRDSFDAFKCCTDVVVARNQKLQDSRAAQIATWGLSTTQRFLEKVGTIPPRYRNLTGKELLRKMDECMFSTTSWENAGSNDVGVRRRERVLEARYGLKIFSLLMEWSNDIADTDPLGNSTHALASSLPQLLRCPPLDDGDREVRVLPPHDRDMKTSDIHAMQSVSTIQFVGGLEMKRDTPNGYTSKSQNNGTKKAKNAIHVYKDARHFVAKAAMHTYKSKPVLAQPTHTASHVQFSFDGLSNQLKVVRQLFEMRIA